MRPIIKINDCRLQLGQSGANHIVFDLPAFTVNPSEKWALIGPSGCGKSTLLNLISGLILPSSGSVSVLEQDIASLPQYKRDSFRGKHIGFIYQSFNLLDGFSALENILIGMRFGRSVKAGQRRSRALEALEQVGLEHRMHHMPATLSVGEKQRVAIARAIANQPAILLADEPTGALDPSTANGVFDLILKLCDEQQCTLLMVTHDLELANKLPHQLDCRALVTQQSAQEDAA